MSLSSTIADLLKIPGPVHGIHVLEMLSFVFKRLVIWFVINNVSVIHMRSNKRYKSSIASCGEDLQIIF